MFWFVIFALLYGHYKARVIYDLWRCSDLWIVREAQIRTPAAPCELRPEPLQQKTN